MNCYKPTKVLNNPEGHFCVWADDLEQATRRANMFWGADGWEGPLVRVN